MEFLLTVYWKVCASPKGDRYEDFIGSSTYLSGRLPLLLCDRSEQHRSESWFRIRDVRTVGCAGMGCGRRGGSPYGGQVCRYGVCGWPMHRACARQWCMALPGYPDDARRDIPTD